MAGIVFGCIVPHPPLLVPDIGRGQEAAISATTQAMEKLTDKLAEQHAQTVLVISPHGEYYGDAMGILTAPSYELDHGVMVPMHFLLSAMKGVPLVPLSFSWLPLETHFAFGKAVGRAVEQSHKRVALVASGDLSHRLIPGAPAGYEPMGKVFDEKLVKALSCMDAEGVLNLDQELIERAGECGLRSFVILLGVLDGLEVKPEILSYEGPFGVGYLVASFEVAS